MSGCKWSAIHGEASLYLQCITWLFAFFEVMGCPWVCSGGASMLG